MATWSYDGAAHVSVTFASTPGVMYRLACGDPDSSFGDVTAAGASTTIDVTDVGGMAATELFDAYVFDRTNSLYVAADQFLFGTTGEGTPVPNVSYDGANSLTVDVPTTAGRSYSVIADWVASLITDSFTGDGTVMSRALDLSGHGLAGGDKIRVTAADNSDPGAAGYSVGLGYIAVYGSSSSVSGSGTWPGSGGGGGGGGGGSDDGGLVQIAFASTALDDTPDWVGVDAHVVSWSVDRGRQSELEQIEAGTATVLLRDATGLLDDLNTLSSLAGQLRPRKQIRIQEIDPRDGSTLVTQFTGYIEDWDYTEDVAEAQLEITLTCVDAFGAVFAKSEVVPDSTGQSSFAQQQVDDAQRARLADAGWPSSKEVIATGNVYVKPVIYQAGTDILTTLHDCHDAEFKGVAIAFMSKTGDYTFHGRKIRFDPAAYPTFVHTYTAADGPRQVGNNSWGKISDIGWGDAEDKIINACLVTPEGIDEADVAGQLATDPTSIGALGVMQQSFTGILCNGNVNTGNTDLDECLLVAQYYVDNFTTPLPQIAKLVFIGRDPADPTEDGTWDIILNVELGDLISVVTVDAGGGGFNAGHFVEHISQTSEQGNGNFTKRRLELVLSPQALYDTNPFSGTDT